MGQGDLVDVRRINDEFASVRHNRLKFVHAFAAHPEFIVHQGRGREHSVERVLLISDVKRPGQVARLIPSVLRRADKKPNQLRMIHDHAETELGHRYHRAGTIHDFAHRGVLVADDHWVGDYRPKPVEEVEHFRPAHARKKVFVTAGKPTNLMRKNRAGDNDLIVLKKQAIDVDGHVHRKQTAALAFDLGGGNGADVLQGQRVIPLVIKQPDRAVFSLTLLNGNFQSMTDRLFAHRLMRAECNHNIECGRARSDLLKNAFEKHSQGTSSGRVWHN